MAVVLALLAGLSYAGAAVLQQRVAAAQPPELSLSPRLLLALVRQPVWLLGIAFDVGAYLLEAGALARGIGRHGGAAARERTAVRAPVVDHRDAARHVTRRESFPAFAVIGGLAAVRAGGIARQVIARPRRSVRGSPLGPSSRSWPARSSRSPCARPGHGARCYSASRRASSTRSPRCSRSRPSTCSTTACARCSPTGSSTSCSRRRLVGLLLNQSAFQAGHVAASLPAISVTNPVLSEHLRRSRCSARTSMRAARSRSPSPRCRSSRW